MQQLPANPFVLCVATSRAQAEVIVGYLHETGFCSRDVSVLFLERTSPFYFGETQSSNGGSPSPHGRAGSGHGFHGAMEWLPEFGMVLLSDGTMRFLAAGPLREAMLRAVQDSGSPADAARQALVNLGLPESGARRYGDRVEEGHSLIAVHAEDSGRIQQAREIFAEMAAMDVAVFGDLPGHARGGATNGPAEDRLDRHRSRESAVQSRTVNAAKHQPPLM